MNESSNDAKAYAEVISCLYLFFFIFNCGRQKFDRDPLVFLQLKIQF